MFDALPDQDRTHKLALLDRALLHAKAATAPGDRVLLVGRGGRTMVRAWGKGKGEDAHERRPSPGEHGSRQRDTGSRLLAPRLARVDLPSALAIANEFPATGFHSTGVLANIAFHLAADNPAEAERVLSLMSPLTGWGRFPPAIAWKMAAVDPARARRLTDQAQQDMDHPHRYLFLALGLKARDPAAASQAFQTAMQGYRRLMKERGVFEHARAA